MEINTLARNNLVSEWGIFDLVWKQDGRRGRGVRCRKFLKGVSLTYSSPKPSITQEGCPSFASHLNGLYTLISSFYSVTCLVLDCPQVVSTGSGGHVDILQRATSCLTYRSLCPPDDLADRGLLGVKSSLYAQDALRLWEIISR